MVHFRYKAAFYLHGILNNCLTIAWPCVIRDYTSLFQTDKTMELKLSIPIHIVWKKEIAACHKDNGNCKDEAITVRNAYPEYPCPSFELTSEMNLKKIDEVR